ncbi:hypothetical protein LXM94_03075 [Rhizobium sp. TRM95111]|uniref:hypothetical protein n=1 Tax=Rhizobium alarense TaxID=2846851 RepID=UPI001F3126B9|nr:hypothetical protein [Rhizobium alarense]MCF3638949.1 hypothetical protein [Rhizobium alarense]
MKAAHRGTVGIGSIAACLIVSDCAVAAEVETVLVRIDSTRRRIGDATVAARNYRASFNAADSNWRVGGASLLDREDARRSAQSAEVSLIEIRRDSVGYWIALYKVLGGGWHASIAPAEPLRERPKGNLL